MTDEEAQFVWRNRKGKLIYTPVYMIYKDNFFQPIIDQTALETTFEQFGDTAVFERWMANAAQFAAAKAAGENELLKKAASMFEDDKVRGYQRYKPIAEEICQRSKDTWLRVEYDTARGNAVSAAQFGRFVENKDLYPYWVYKGVMDARERPEHVALEGMVFRIGDPYGDAVHPKNDWNCRCDAINVDDRFLKENNRQPATEAQSKELLEKYVDEQFRFNSYNQGMLPNDRHSYFEAMGSANEGDFERFNLSPTRDLGKGDLEGLAAIDLHKVVNYVTKWEKTEHTKGNGEIVFQNKRLYTNVIWNNLSLHQVGRHARGVENLPATIADPDEVWTSWADAENQRVTKRVYLKFGKTSYLVQTTDGIIQDAFAVSAAAADRYRKGVII
jgi:SPP1 gp7 family putative phage head morphogenesis protein